jgi:hypothetical protein
MKRSAGAFQIAFGAFGDSSALSPAHATAGQFGVPDQPWALLQACW